MIMENCGTTFKSHQYLTFLESHWELKDSFLTLLLII